MCSFGILSVGLNLSYGRRSVDQFLLVSGLPLGHMTRFIFLFFFFWLTITFILFPMASSLTRKWVCSLECLHSLARSLTTNNHTLSSHPRLCSLSVASYDSQRLRWKYSNPPPHGSLKTISPNSYITFSSYLTGITLRHSNQPPHGEEGDLSTTSYITFSSYLTGNVFRLRYRSNPVTEDQ
jgi:hypothetical protein